MTKVWNEFEVKQLLLKNDRAVERALMALYHRQTVDEQVSSQTKTRNGKGFNAKDAFIFTSLAESFLKFRKLSFKQIELLRGKNGQHRIGKYWRQLLEVAEGNGYKVSYKPSQPLLGWGSLTDA